MKSILWTVIFTALLLFSFPVHANLSLCNRSDETITAAVGYWSGSQYVSEGWWNIEPGDCQTLWTGNANGKKLYYYARSQSRKWGGNYTFCTKSSAFTIYGDENCSSRNYNQIGFRRIAGDEFTERLNLTVSESYPDLYKKGLLHGTWKVTETEDDLDIEMEVTYSPGGYYSWNVSVTDGVNTMLGYGSGRWSLQNSYLTERITSSTLPDVIPVGFEARTKIISMGLSKIKFYDDIEKEYYYAYYQN